MQYENYFSIGDKLDIEVEQKYESAKLLKSQLLEVSNKASDEYYISIPMEKGKMIPLSVGKEIYAYYSLDGKGVYCFKAVVVDRGRDPVLHLRIRQTGKTQKIQRRDYFRLHMLLPVEVFDVNKNLISTGNTKDISGGGMRFTLPGKIESNEEVYVNVEIEGKQYQIKCVVLRRIPVGEDLNDYEVAVQFTHINEGDRNNIVKYIFKHQRILRQKGLI
ncbi:c-di-GMP-binding flagellar brake protein YcgR, contains PilZNR and PilZ domains [Peptoclostridium litorale DSM 5388]|uniref:Glycosyltransferase n=1 Tax=Peptoclostridium litorale DSM 5388 TaxID=1121324 RepID=A0A069REI7_PEPLI|nr:flagellar brake protein [Peptoclostridium litorale]KDR95183.1 hypothetical protein CLIT_11c02120 [Peptoclostridium litorale DSM 5388]SIN73690.1 c-di-GMP-binding flagellar brake protein YcgR, contains PilZNR and PilZ domains [Peptoclostridium litorale DSM 5388]